jgi:lysophospholipase L1-like esterase
MVYARIAVLLAVVVCVQAQLKILPYGDSNTQGGFLNQGSYRTQLGLLLKGNYDPTTTSKPVVSFVGSQYAYGDHEGHSGWKTTDLIRINTWVLQHYSPDYIMLEIGTNDFYFNRTIQETVGNMTVLLNDIFTINSKITVLVGAVFHIIPDRCKDYIMGACPPNMEENIEGYNKQLPGIVNTFKGRGYNIYFVDIPAEAGLVPDDYWTWGIHFNVTGYAKIAQVWYKHLAPLLPK